MYFFCVSVKVRDVAKLVGKDVSAIYKALKRENTAIFLQYDDSSRGQKAGYISDNAFDLFMVRREIGHGLMYEEAPPYKPWGNRAKDLIQLPLLQRRYAALILEAVAGFPPSPERKKVLREIKRAMNSSAEPLPHPSEQCW